MTLVGLALLYYKNNELPVYHLHHLSALFCQANNQGSESASSSKVNRVDYSIWICRLYCIGIIRLLPMYLEESNMLGYDTIQSFSCQK